MSNRVRLVLCCLLLITAVVINCKPGNLAPTIILFSGADSIYPGGTVLFVCSATDPEGDPLTYEWASTHGTLSSTADSAVIWSAPESACVATVSVKVVDSHQGIATRKKSVTVTAAANRPPVINTVSGPDSVEAGGTAVLSCDAIDPDGDTLLYAWSCDCGGLSGTSGPNVTWYAPDSSASAVITVIVSDGRAADTATKAIGVRPMPNRPPVVDSISGPSSVGAGGTVALTCWAYDPDGDSLTYWWTCTKGRFTSATTPSTSWILPESSGTGIATVRVRDGRGGEAEKNKTITITKVTTTVLDTQGVYIAAGASMAFYMTLKVGYTAYGAFSVPQHDITFMILDSTNYHRWANRQSYDYLRYYYKSEGSAYSVVIPATKRYYFLLDNTYSIFTPKYASLSIRKTTP